MTKAPPLIRGRPSLIREGIKRKKHYVG